MARHSAIHYPSCGLGTHNNLTLCTRPGFWLLTTNDAEGVTCKQCIAKLAAVVADALSDGSMCVCGHSGSSHARTGWSPCTLCKCDSWTPPRPREF